MPVVSSFTDPGAPSSLPTPTPPTSTVVQSTLALQIYDTRLTFAVFLWFIAYSIGHNCRWERDECSFDANGGRHRTGESGY